MSRQTEESDDGWGRDPAVLDLTPDSSPDRTVDTGPKPPEGRDGAEAETERLTSSTADTLVRNAMADGGTGSSGSEAFETCGVVGHRREE